MINEVYHTPRSDLMQFERSSAINVRSVDEDYIHTVQNNC